MKKIFFSLLAVLFFAGCKATRPKTATYLVPSDPVGMPEPQSQLRRAPMPAAEVISPVRQIHISWCRSPKDAPERALVYEVWSCTDLALQNWQLVSTTSDLFYDAPASKDMEFFRIRAKDVSDGTVGAWATNEPCGTL